MKFCKLSVALLLLPVVAGCQLLETSRLLTPLEIQSLQSREFNTSLDIAFSSAIAVLRNQGFKITDTDKNAGLVSAEKAASPTGEATLQSFQPAEGSVTLLNKVNIFFEKLPNTRILIRLSYVKSQSASAPDGITSRRDDLNLNPDTYRIAFEQIEDEIFRRQGI